MRTKQTNRPFRRVGIVRLTWPLMAVTVLTLAATLANTVVLSIASQELNAAVATANQILGVLYDVCVLFSIGALVVISQLLGGGQHERAARATVVALRASSVLGVLIAVAVAAASPWLLRLVNTPADIREGALTYLLVAGVAMAFNAYIVAATAVLRAYGRTVLILVLGVVVNVLDVLLLVLLVLVLELGPLGAALPSLLVRGVGVLLLDHVIRRQAGVGVASSARTTVSADQDTGAMAMARLSVPTVVENGMFNLAVVFLVSLINVLGTDAINARSYALTLTALVTGVILALVQGNETLVGWDVGERSTSQARRRTLLTVLVTMLSAGLLGALLWRFAEPALSIFSPTAATLDGAVTLLLLSVVLLPLQGASAVLFGALRSAGDVVVPMCYSLIATLGLLIPLSWLFVSWLDLGLAGAWWALILAEGVRAGLLLARWVLGSWAPPSTSRVPARA